MLHTLIAPPPRPPEVLRVAVCVSGNKKLPEDILKYIAPSFPAGTIIHYFFYLCHSGYETLDDLTLAVKGKMFGAQSQGTLAVDNFYAPFEKYDSSFVEIMYAMRRCNMMKMEAELDAGRDYDIVVRLRSDYVLARRLDFGRYVEILRDFVLMPEARFEKGRMDDEIVLSSSRNMDVYCSVYDYVLDYVQCGCQYQPERLMRFHMMATKLEPVWKPGKAWQDEDPDAQATQDQYRRVDATAKS